MNKFIILRALFKRRETAAQVEGIVDDMNSTEDSWELSRFEREKISFQTACAPRISIIKQNARWKREEKQR